jgi:hypothetical protein
LVLAGSATTQAFTDTGLVAGTQYSYAVFAHDGVPNYSAAASVSITTGVPTAAGISFVGVQSSRSGFGQAPPVALPAGWKPGDLAIVLAVRKNNEGIIPSLATGWSAISASLYGAAGPEGLSVRLGSRVLQAGDTTSGAWIGANSIQMAVYRNVGSIGSNAVAFTGPGVKTITFPAIGVDSAGSSWVVGIGEHYMFTSNAKLATVSGAVTRTSSSATPETLVVDTNGAVSSWPQHVSSVLPTGAGAIDNSIGFSIELVSMLAPVPARAPDATATASATTAR